MHLFVSEHIWRVGSLAQRLGILCLAGWGFYKCLSPSGVGHGVGQGICFALKQQARGHKCIIAAMSQVQLSVLSHFVSHSFPQTFVVIRRVPTGVTDIHAIALSHVSALQPSDVTRGLVGQLSHANRGQKEEDSHSAPPATN